MKFKKLSLIGFKSFADKLEVKFGEGITAIVGPNGCGKSNVADAVRWVLGEQSARLLRGSSMQDVIFNGTDKRNSLSYAEVSLIFDNKNRELFPSYEYEEVVITRKLFRSGESEYYTNGSLCRLRDISNMLRDGGFGREGYTIIGQGKIDELLNSKPEDRRAIFEEAAGISKYKFKKTEAERRNARTRDNLTRIDDAMAGDLSRLEPLTKQAEKARLYFELKEKLKYHEINYYINQYESAAGVKDKINSEIIEIDNAISNKQRDYDRVSQDYSDATEKIRSIENDLERDRAELMNLTVGREKTAGEANVISERLNHIGAQNDALISENAALNDNYNNLIGSAENKQNELNIKDAQLRKMDEDCNTLNAEYNELATKVAQGEEKLESSHKALIATMQKKAEVRMNMGELTAERATRSSHLETLNSRIAEYGERILSGQAELSARESELETLAYNKNELAAEYEKITHENALHIERLSELVDKIAELKQDYSVAVSRRKMLAEMQNAMEGYAFSVRKLLADAKNDACVADAMLGVVGQIISVKEGFETAIEMALGATVSNVVTKTEEDAKFLINHLKSHSYGRATFLPISSFKPRSVDDKFLPLLNRPGCYGVATSAVQCDDIFRSVVSGMLGSTVIVQDMDTAVSLARDSKYGFRIVTLDGDVIFPHGSITGGSKKSDVPSVFSHERELKGLNIKVDELKASVENLQTEREIVSVKNSECSKRIRELTDDIHSYEVAEASQTAELSRLKDNLEALKREKLADEEDSRVNSERLAAINADLDLVGKLQDEISEDERTAVNDEEQKRFEELRIIRDAKRDEVTALRMQFVTLSKDVESLRNEIARLKSEAVGTAQRLERNNMSILENNRQMEELNGKLRVLTDYGSGENNDRISVLHARLDDMTAYRTDLNEKAVNCDGLRIKLSDEIRELTEKKHEKDILLTKVDSDMESMQERILQEYGIDYKGCLEFKDAEYDPEVGYIEIGKARRRISNLGTINEDAIKDSQELAQKYHEKEVQREDLVKSLADEERIIKEMSDNMMREFDTCFEMIRVNFKEIFYELFNGGTADLVLTENEDPLLRGVEIIAQPPSKKLQSITLLSGGEKAMTAIAILFAILKLRPMPFCILDEIEAALDDANVGRFATYLKKFSAETQFIVITHRKPTMEQADCLYGVTMEEKGISKIVSVKLSDAVQNALVGATD